MKFKKSQGQTLERVTIDPRSHVFSHEQLYVPLCRATKHEHVLCLITDENRSCEMKIPVNVPRRARQCRVTQGLSKFQRSLAYTSRYNTLHYFQRVLQDGTLALVVMINYHRCNIIDIFVLLAFKSARIVLLQLQPELHSRSHVQRLTTFDG